jgi:uncharacterized protein YkwD
MRLPHRILIFLVLTLANSGWLMGNPYARMEPDEFAALPELAACIDPDRSDRALLGAAIFHETNRVRRELGLPAFKPNRRLDDAADLQAGMAAASGRYDHSNPILGRESVASRAREAGLGEGAVAENVATTPLVDVGEEENVLIQREGDRRIFRNPTTGKELPVRSYAGYAGEVVKQWMNSPRHRANIVSRKYRSLGCSVRFGRLPNGADLLVSVQVFHSPTTSSK